MATLSHIPSTDSITSLITGMARRNIIGITYARAEASCSSTFELQNITPVALNALLC